MIEATIGVQESLRSCAVLSPHLVGLQQSQLYIKAEGGETQNNS